EDRVVRALEAEGRLIALGDVAAAHRARAVRRKEQGLVAERQDLLVNGVVQKAGVLSRLLPVRQIRAARLTDEEPVAGEDAPRTIGRLLDEDGVAHALRRVARRVEGAEAKAAERKFLAVGEAYVSVTEELAASVDDRGAGDPGELRRSKDEVLLPVRLDHV